VIVRTLCRLSGDLRLPDGTAVNEVEPGTSIDVSPDNASRLMRRMQVGGVVEKPQSKPRKGKTK